MTTKKTKVRIKFNMEKIKKISIEGLQKVKDEFEKIYKKKPSKEIMEIISENETQESTQENDEVICYARYKHGLQCKWNEQ